MPTLEAITDVVYSFVVAVGLLYMLLQVESNIVLVFAFIGGVAVAAIAKVFIDKYFFH